MSLETFGVPLPGTGNDPVASPPSVTPQAGDVAATAAPTNGNLPQPQAAPQPEAKQPFWKSLLQGALRGLAGSAGSKSFGGGLAGGAEGEIAGQQRDFQNKMATDANARENAQSAAGIRFQDLQSAKAAADINRTGVEIAKMNEETRQSKEKFGMEQVAFNQTNFGTQYKQVPFTKENALLYLQQASNGTPGAHVPDGVVVTPQTLYIPVSEGENSVASDYGRYKAQGDALGLNTISRAQYMGMNPAQRRATTQITNDIFSGSAQPAQVNSRINLLQSSIATYKNNPNANPGMLQHMGDLLTQYQNLKSMNEGDKDVQQTRNQKTAVASAGARNDTRVLPITDSSGTSSFARAGDVVGKPGVSPDNHGGVFMGTLPDGRQVAGTQQELQAAGVDSVSKLSPDETTKVHTARQMIAPNGLFHAVATDIAALEKNNQLGTVASRWNDFLSGKVGTGPEFASLRANMGLLATALMQAHMGNRGGQEATEHFKHLADYRISDAATLRSALSSEFKYVTEKSAFIPKAGK